jgi:hypothetical protein
LEVVEGHGGIITKAGFDCITENDLIAAP